MYSKNTETNQQTNQQTKQPQQLPSPVISFLLSSQQKAYIDKSAHFFY